MSRQTLAIQTIESFGQLIKRLREELCIPQRKVAAMLDVDSSTLSKIEKGERYPKPEMIIKLASYFNLDQEDLLVVYLSDKILDDLKGVACLEKVLEAAQCKAVFCKLETAK